MIELASNPWAWLTATTAPWWAIPLFTVLGGVLTWLLTLWSNSLSKAREERRLTREMRLAAYIDFAQAAYQAMTNMERNSGDMLGGFDRLRDTLLRVQLVGSTEVREAAGALVETFSRPAAERSEAIGEASIKYNETVRRELA